jgi:Fic family protein
MADLIEFANRDDISAVAQSAIVHAQFETIHPFTDGNGRIGRALINAVLRRRGLTSQTVTPLASAMVADRQGYFDLVNSYRLGELTPFVSSVARSAQIASTAARVSAGELEALPAMWATQTTARAGSSAQAVLRILLDRPVLSAVDAMRMTGGSESSVYSAMDRLEADGIIHEVTNRKRDKVWAATAVLEEMTALTERIADAVAEERDAR